MTNLKLYDVAILGGGVGGATCAYKLIEENPKLKILIIDNSSKQSSGWRNDCKFNYDPEIGIIGNAAISKEEWLSMFDYSLDMFRRFIGELPEPVINHEKIKDLEARVESNCANFHFAKQYHLGTDIGVKFTTGLYNYLRSKGVEIKSKSTVYHVDINGDGSKKVFFMTDRNQQQRALSDKVVVSLGRNNGEHTTLMIAKALGLNLKYNRSQFGGRLEILNSDYPITAVMYDPKIYFPFDTKTFCTNPGGHVVAIEKDIHLGLTLVNGHAYNGNKSDNTNLALIVRMDSPDSHLTNREYATAFATRILKAGNGKPVAQRVEHFMAGVPSTNRHFEPEYVGVKSTLTRDRFVHGNLKESMDTDIYQKFVDTLRCLDNIIGGNRILRGDGILYFPEVKNSVNISTKETYESVIPGLYFMGDGAGKTRGINGAGATGQVVAKDILEKVK